MEGDVICLQEIFTFSQEGIGKDGHAAGQVQACGVRPRVMNRLQAEGHELPRNLFERKALRSTV